MRARTGILAAVVLTLGLAPLPAAELWSVGEFDGRCGEFALEPGTAPESYTGDGLFCPGLTTVKASWPYAQPGPEDVWAGSTAHAFDVIFGVGRVPAPGECTLKIGVLDSQPDLPPRLRIEVNGQSYEHVFDRATTPGLGIRGDFARANASTASVRFPASLLKPGVNTIRIVSIAGSWFVYDAVSLDAPAGAEPQAVTADQLQTARAALPQIAPVRPQLERVVIVYKTHFDLGYTDLAKNVVELYRRGMIESTLRVIDANRDLPPEQQFVWTIPGWPMEQMLGVGQEPARQAKIEQAIRDGHLVVHALPGSTHTCTMEVEDLVRGLGHSSRLARRFGLPLPRGAKTTDVPAHCWLMPTVLHQAGVDFMHIGVNDATTPPKTPLLFWWEGPDGSRLLTMLTNTYGTWHRPPPGWPHRTWLAILQTYDNVGPPSPETIKRDLDFYAKNYPGVKVQVGQLSDFFDALKTEDLSTVPIVRGDMPDCWIYGPASSPVGCRTIAQARRLLPATESLATLNAAWGVQAPDPRQAVAAAYEQSFLWSEHTWGLASQHHVSFQFVKEGEITKANPLPPQNIPKMEASWEEHIDYARQVENILRQPSAEQLAALAGRVAVEGRRVVVFNPLSWQRDDLVQVAGDWGPAARVQSDDGADVPAEVADGVLRFVARDVPSLGYRTYRVTGLPAAPPPAADCTANTAKHTIECPTFRAVFDPARGRIASLVDKRTNRELIDDSAPQGFGYFYQRFSKQDALDCAKGYLRPGWAGSHGDIMCRTSLPADQQHVEFTPADMSFEATVTPIRVTATLAGTLSAAVPQDVRITLTLYRDLPFVDLHVTVDNHGRIDAWPEACWLSLPLRIDRPQFRVGVPGSVVDPAAELLPDTSRHYCWANPGVAVFNDQGGVGVAAVHTPLVSLGEPGLMKFNGAYVPTQPRVFINLQNNVWHTNFLDWFSGRIEADVRLWPFDQYQATALTVPGLDAKRPLLAAVADGPAGTLPARQPGITLSRPGVLVTAFGPDPDGNPGTLLRLWDHSGVPGKLTVTLPKAMPAAWATPVNLRGVKTGPPIAITEGELTLDLGCFAPASFIVNSVSQVRLPTGS